MLWNCAGLPPLKCDGEPMSENPDMGHPVSLEAKSCYADWSLWLTLLCTR
jgi:hypothetical protein